jgi:Mg2+ and Co2+ transporter CorA
MTSFSDDPTRNAVFEHLAGPPGLMSHEMNLSILEWTRGAPVGQSYDIQQASDLTSLPARPLRIILAPLDLPDNSSGIGFPTIFRHYSVPSSFLSERIQSVAHSFGTRAGLDGSESAWFHFLCKNITTARSLSNTEHVEIKDYIRFNEKDQSQADYSWIRAGFYLKIDPPPVKADATTQQVNSSEPTEKNAKDTGSATLICFGASDALVNRFKRLLKHPDWNDAVEDPYILFDIILDELYLQVDGIAWTLQEVFSGTERRIFDRASAPEHAAGRIDFVGLHNIAKHIVHLRESSDAILHTVRAISKDHASRSLAAKNLSPVIQAVECALHYRTGVFNSTYMRITSMEKRAQNLIQLSFNLVAQQDSRVIQVDSKIMMLIALVTLLFLPSSTIATIFGSQFFIFDSGDVDKNGLDLQISSQFWLYWAISIPLTGLVLLGAWVFFLRMKKDVLHGSRPPQGGRVASWMSERSKENKV